MIDHVSESELLDTYIKEIRKYPLLNKKTQAELISRIKDGDEKARELFISSNLKYVVNVAMKYMYKGLSLLDLINEGNIGLINSLEKYDPDKGTFTTYSIWWIKNSIVRAIEQFRTIRVPANVSGIESKIKNADSSSMQGIRAKSLEEFSVETGVPLWKVQAIFETKEPVSLDEPIGDEDFTLKDCLSDDAYPTPFEQANYNDLKSNINESLKELSSREAEILQLKFGLNNESTHTLTEIAKTYSLSRERIRQIVEKAINKLRKNPQIVKLKNY